MLCRHCNQGKPVRPRGLCWRCYYRPGVRDLYPSTSKYAPKGVDKAALMAALRAGTPPKNIARRFGISRERVYQIRRDLAAAANGRVP